MGTNDKVDPILERLDEAKEYLKANAGMFDPEFLRIIATLVAIAKEEHLRLLDLEREVGPGSQFVDMAKMDLPGRIRP